MAKNGKKKGFPGSAKLKEMYTKLEELILYVSKVSEGDDSFGSTKLNKLLFYADFTAYLKFGKPITGINYRRLNFGPAPVDLVPIREKMVRSKDLYVAQTKFYNQQQEKPIALREADLTIFSSDEIALVDELIRKFWGVKASEISALSHNFVGWRLAKENEIIPYSVARVHKREPGLKEIAYARKLMAQRSRPNAA